MTKFLWASLALPLICAATAASAKEDARLTLSLTAGSLGIGPEVTYRVNKTIGIRGNATFFSLNRGITSDDIRYDGKVKLKSGGVMLDLYPFGGGFRISGGARINGNNGSVTATPTTNVQVGNTTYTPAQIGTLSGGAETKDFAPTLTIGYTTRKKGLSFGIDAGVMFQDEVRIQNFVSSTGLISPSDLEKERQSVQNDVDDFKVYPILQVAVGYAF